MTNQWNWTGDELHLMSKLLLMTNVPIPEESKGIKQWQEYGNLAKEAILGLNGDKPQKLTSKSITTIQCTCWFQ